MFAGVAQRVLRLGHAAAECSAARERAVAGADSNPACRLGWRRGQCSIWEDLRYAGERCGRHRVARLMRRAGLQGVSQRRRWWKKPSRARPDGTQNHLNRDFKAAAPNTKCVRHHLHPHGRTLVVPLHCAGYVFRLGRELVNEPTSGPAVGGPRGADGVVAAPRTDPSHSAF